MKKDPQNATHCIFTVYQLSKLAHQLFPITLAKLKFSSYVINLRSHVNNSHSQATEFLSEVNKMLLHVSIFQLQIIRLQSQFTELQSQVTELCLKLYMHVAVTKRGMGMWGPGLGSQDHQKLYSTNSSLFITFPSPCVSLSPRVPRPRVPRPQVPRPRVPRPRVPRPHPTFSHSPCMCNF